MKVPLPVLILVLLPLARLAHSDPVDNWVEVPKPAGVPAALTSVAYGKVSTTLGTVGIFVAVGENGVILTSIDGASWSAQNSEAQTTLLRVKLANERLFAFGTDGTETVVSPDGSTWTKIKNFNDLTFANGSYFGVDFIERSVWRSTDLQNWTRTTPPNGFSHATIDAFNGTLVGGQTGGSVDLNGMTISKDGVTWAPGALRDIANSANVQNNLFFVNGQATQQFPPFGGPFTGLTIPAPAVFYSIDLIDWRLSAPGFGPSNPVYSRVAAGGSNYVALEHGTVYHTSDLTNNWASFGPGVYDWKAIGGNWIAANLPITNGVFGYVSDVAFGPPNFVAIADGRIFRSEPVGGAFAPQIYKQPASFAATVGSTATLTVGAQGTPPISYQWRKNGTTINGATNSVLALNNFTFSDAGGYDVIVSNPGGTVQSANASISVNFAEVHTYTGITLLGSSGDKFLIESKDTLDPSAAWQSVTNISLLDIKYTWIDLQSPDLPKRYFRATYQGR